MPCPRNRSPTRSRSRKASRCVCLDVVIIVALLGAVSYAAVSMLERYIIHKSLYDMRATLEVMSKFVAKTDSTYDELHSEIDRITGQTISRTQSMEDGGSKYDDEEELRSLSGLIVHQESAGSLQSGRPKSTGSWGSVGSGSFHGVRKNSRDEHSQTDKMETRSGNIQTGGSDSLKKSEGSSDSFGRNSQKYDSRSDSDTGSTESDDCDRKCAFLPAGVYCGQKNCKNKDVFKDRSIYPNPKNGE